MVLLAYLDPGTGSIILQAVIGSVLDGMPLHSPYTTEIFWARIRTAIASMFGKKPVNDESDE